MAVVNAMMHVVLAVEAATIHRAWLTTRPGDYAAQVRQRIEPGLYYPATRYCGALALRGRITAQWIDTVMAA